MKIGEVAEKYNISKDTLRYYLKSGLLIPGGMNKYSRLEFQDRDLEDLELILRMKDQQFSLKEILTMLTLRRTSNMVEPQTVGIYTQLYEGKKRELQKQIGELNRAIDSIEQDKARLTEESGGTSVMTGVPLRALSLLQCLVCGGTLRLERADLDAHYIYRGSLCCSCGKKLQIENGIVETGNRYTGKYDRPDIRRELYSNAGGLFVSYVQKGLDEIYKYLHQNRHKTGVIMETHINSFFFAYNHLDAIPEDSLCIVVDKFPELLSEYKRLLEFMGVQRDFLYIADNSMKLPLRKNSVDLLINCMSDNEYCLYSSGSYIEDVKPFLKDEADVIGILLSFDGYTESQRRIHKKYPEGNEDPFSRKLYEQQYQDAGYHLTLKEEGAVWAKENGEQFVWSCLVPEDPLLIAYLHAVPQRE